MVWVLVLLLTTTSSYGGAHAYSIEFTSQENCESARKFIVQSSERSRGFLTTTIIADAACLPK